MNYVFQLDMSSWAGEATIYAKINPCCLLPEFFIEKQFFVSAQFSFKVKKTGLDSDSDSDVKTK